jgi:hypothetical protein
VDLLNNFPKKNPGNNVAVVVSDAYPRLFQALFRSVIPLTIGFFSIFQRHKIS